MPDTHELDEPHEITPKELMRETKKLIGALLTIPAVWSLVLLLHP